MTSTAPRLDPEHLATDVESVVRTVRIPWHGMVLLIVRSVFVLYLALTGRGWMK